MLPPFLNPKQSGWLVRRKLAWYWRYLVPVIAVAIAYALTFALPAIRSGAPFMFFFLAVTVSSLLANFRAGLFAILLSVIVVDLWVLPPVGQVGLEPEDFARLASFAVVSLLIVAVGYMVNRSHQTIYEQAEWLRITLSSIGDAVIATDMHGNVVWQNAMATSLTGWTLEEAVGQPLIHVFRIIHEQRRTPVEDPVAHVMAEGKAVGPAYHTILVAKDGTERLVDHSAAPIQDATGQITGVVLIIQDVGEGRQQELAVKLSEERLRLALRAGRMVAWEWNVPTSEIWMTDNFAEIYGTSIRNTAEGQKLLHPDDVEYHSAAVQHSAEQGTGYHLEFRILHPEDQRVVWLEEWGFPVQDKPGLKAQRVAGVTVDITERKVAEQEIRRLNSELSQRVQELQAVFDLALVGICVAYDASCEVVVRNEILAEWLGVPSGRGISASASGAERLPFRLLRHGADVPPSMLPMQRSVAEARSIVDEELEIVRKDGFRRTVMVSTAPIFHEVGHVIGCVGIYADITERKDTENALRHLTETLEQRVAERTAELEQINRELVDFTNTVSHDLRAPLRAITALSQWVDEESGAALSPSSREYLVRMRQRVERMEKLINDLVVYTRAGRVQYQKEVVNPAQLVNDIVYLLDVPAGFSAAVEEPMPVFVAERAPLETVLRNLIGNAIKHHPNPTLGHVTISAREQGEWVEFRVTDDGAGIDPAYRERIFGVFQTLRPRDEVEGSGMGLAIAKRLVEGRGGHIAVEAAPEQGSIFVFTWPKA